MGYTVMKVEGQGGADDQIKVIEGTGPAKTETVFDDIDSAASYMKVESDWLEEHLDNADYDEELDVEELQAEDEAEEEDEESGKSA